MTSAIHSAVGGALAHQTKVGAGAHNLANVNTDGYKKLRVDLEAGQPAGVRAVPRRVETPGLQRFDPSAAAAGPREGSNVDLAEELTQLLVAERGFEANLETIRAEDEMLGSLLDLVG